MSSRTRELETVISLIGEQYKSEEVRWVVVALIGVVEILIDYHDVNEEGDEEAREDLELRAVESIEDIIHSWLVHKELPMTEEERTALQDQEVAELREQIKNYTGVEFLDLDDMFGLNKASDTDKEEDNGDE